MNVKIGEIKQPITLEHIGGRDADGSSYGANSRYLTKDGRPILPVMGEFHFSRWQPAEWEEAILKMRAGGIGIVATYVFWNHHEEHKGEWDFSGCRDIHAFLEVCKKVDMPVWLRIGPWAHGESRNGGFPDWLVSELGHNGLYFMGESREYEARCNDALYLEYVNRFWDRLSREVYGEMCAQGGPVIGIQLENEYCHAGGPADKSRGVAHMQTLYELAYKYGFVAPYYTATGWGGAVVLEGLTLPVLGGYVDAPWAGHTHEMPACGNFLFTPFREDEQIGADLAIDAGAACTFDKEKNPYLTAELGGGLQATALRRPYPYAEDTLAQAVCMLGAGANLLGYYMYHGGTNPDGHDTTLQEARETGYFNDLPVKSYDFAACIRESGQLNDSYHKLKMLHLLIHAFEESLAPAAAYFPDEQPADAENMMTPRLSVRYNHDTAEGFLFINNHQRLRHMQTIEGLDVTVGGQTLHDISVPTDACAVIPFGLQMGESRLVATNASLLTRIGSRYFFYQNTDAKPYFEYEDNVYDNVVVLTREEAEHVYVFGESLYITPRAMFEQDDSLWLLAGEEEERVRIYEKHGDPAELYVLPPEIMTHVDVTIMEETQQTPPTYAVQPVLEQESTHNMCKIYTLTLQYHKVLDEYADETSEDYLHDVFLTLDFAGNRAQLYQNEHLLTDWFANGESWNIALRRYAYPTQLTLVVYPYEENVYYDLPPKKGCELLNVSATAEYKLEL